jgi:hypothetical protein
LALPPDPEALERARDGRRRRADALRLVPVLGAVLFLFPLLLSANAGWNTATVGLYLFAAWAVLIALVGWLSHRVGRALGEDAEDPSGAAGRSAPRSRQRSGPS